MTSLLAKKRVGVYPGDDIKNVSVCLTEEGLSLFCTIMGDKRRDHGLGAHGGGFGVFRGKVLTGSQELFCCKCLAEMGIRWWARCRGWEDWINKWGQPWDPWSNH